MNIGLRKRCFVLNGCYTVFSFLGKILQWLGITEKNGPSTPLPGPVAGPAAGGDALPGWQIHAGHPTAVDERCSVSRLLALAPYARLHVNRAVRQRGTARMAI